MWRLGIDSIVLAITFPAARRLEAYLPSRAGTLLWRLSSLATRFDGQAGAQLRWS